MHGAEEGGDRPRLGRFNFSRLGSAPALPADAADAMRQACFLAGLAGFDAELNIKALVRLYDDSRTCNQIYISLYLDTTRKGAKFRRLLLCRYDQHRCFQGVCKNDI